MVFTHKLTKKNQRGFTLIELLLVLTIVVFLSVIIVSQLSRDSIEIGGGERLVEEAGQKIRLRRADAVRLNGDDRRSAVSESFVTAPLPIRFDDLTTTGTLQINGADRDHNCVDDDTNQALTCLRINAGRAEWSLAVNKDRLELPAGWRVARSDADLGSVGLIGSGQRGRGVLAIAVGFDAHGYAAAQEELGVNNWRPIPSGAVKSDEPSLAEAPFWAIYFVAAKSVNESRSNAGAAVAVAVHPSGQIEQFRFNGREWVGFENRRLAGNQ